MPGTRQTEHDPWQKIRWPALVRLIKDRPAGQCWQLHVSDGQGRNKLTLTSPRQVQYEFKLNQGAWIRKIIPKQP